jgi:succinoglycan biosynthesis transport protein ExoP
MEQVTTVGLADLWAIARRRAAYFTIAFLVVFAVAVGLAIFLPPVYESKTTILIEEQQIPLDMIRTTVTDFVEQRLQTITQQFMTRKNLLDLVQRFDLYKKERRNETNEEIVERFREDIALNPISAEVVDRRTGRPTTATIAFEVSYQGEDPRRVQQVANVLASFYLSKNVETREEHAKSSTEFLEQERDRVAEEIKKIDAQLVELKERFMGSLPEQAALNQQTLERLERDKAALATRIEDFRVRRDQLDGELFARQAVVRSEGPTPAERIKELRIQEANLLAKYSASHPDVVKIRREIEEVEADAATQARVDARLKDLQTARLSLESETDPGKRAELQAKIDGLRDEIAALDPQAARGAEEESLTRDPYYLSAKNQLEGVMTSIRSLEEEVATIDKRVEILRAQIAATPKVEARYRQLLTDRENRNARYQEVVHKLEEAKASIQLERDQMAERFAIIDPAVFPEEPIKPNRLALTFIGLILGIGFGVGVAAAAEAIDTTFHSASKLEQITGIPVLAVIGAVQTARDVAARRFKRLVVAGSTISLLVAAVAVVHFMVKPLDVLWLQVTGNLAAKQAQQATDNDGQ